jgi:hypothetical protein
MLISSKEIEAAVVPAFLKTTLVIVAGDPNIESGAVTLNQALT